MDAAAERKTKKRIQNRAAQRSYRWPAAPCSLILANILQGQRMKARVEELQTKVEILEGGRQHEQLPPMNAQLNSQSSPNASNAPLCITQRRLSEMRSNESLERNTLAFYHSSNANHDSTNINGLVSTTSTGAPESANQMPQTPKPMTGSGLSSTSCALNDIQLDHWASGLLTSSESSYTFSGYVNYAAGKDQQPDPLGSTNDMHLQMLSTITPPEVVPISNSRSRSPPSGSSSLSPDLISLISDVQFPQGSWTSEIKNVQSEPDDAKNPEAEVDSAFLLSSPQLSAQLGMDATLEDRLKHITEQAKLAGFEDLNEVITAYHISMAGENSKFLVNLAQTSLRRLPRLIATLRYAAKEWKDWERRGFPLD